MFGLNNKDPDEELIKRALTGSERAWLTLVKRHEQRLYNYALRMSGNPDDAMDILQDILMSVYRNLASFRGDSRFTTWLFRIASFRSTDFFRKRSWQTSQIEDQEMLQDESRTFDPDWLFTRARDNDGIARLMSALPPDQRQVVELKYFQHFTFDEIAGQLGISPNTAKTRLYTALTRMRTRSSESLASNNF